MRNRTASSGLAWVIPFFVIGGIIAVLGVGIRYWISTGGWTAYDASWSGKEPFECGGNDQVELHGVNADLPGMTAIIADGNCHLKLVDSNIKADTVVEAGGNAEVTFQGGSVNGKTAADASGNARVRFNGTKVTGEKKKSANGKVD